jgi:hypothetical protein
MQFLCACVSTSDQTAAHQFEQARAAGLNLDEDNVIKDEGVSGISTCFAERDGGGRLLDKLRAGNAPVVRWLDRLGHGRDYDDERALSRSTAQAATTRSDPRRLPPGPWLVLPAIGAVSRYFEAAILAARSASHHQIAGNAA